MSESRKKILLVEDDWFTRFMMQEIRDTLNVEIDIADSVSDGLSRFRDNPDAYGLVLMDAQMPVDNGHDAGQPFHDMPERFGQEVPIIAVSTDERLLDDGLLRSYGISGHLRKPVPPGELMALIDRYC